LAKAPHFDTILTGAGISIPSPSVLPDGNALASIAWRLVNFELGALDERQVQAVTDRFWGENDGLRLEQLIDVMTFGIDLKVLVSAYDAVADAKHNYIHLRLVELAAASLFTVNMDSLLEDACKALGANQSLTHLHGIHSDHDSIVTTISQYLQDLPPHLHQQLREAITGKRVLVVGYSGRDRDIMPLFRLYAPQELTWLVHPRADDDPSVSRNMEVEQEARDLLDDLTARFGAHRIHETRTRAEHFLDSKLPLPSPMVAALRPLVSAVPAKPDIWPLPTSGIDAYVAVPTWRRKLAVAAVLRDLGMTEVMLAVLRRTHIPVREADARVGARKLKGRGLKRAGHPRRALLVFLLPIIGVWYLRQLRAVANEVASTLTHAGLPGSARILDRALVKWGSSRGGEFARAATFAQGRIAQRASAAGDLPSASSAFQAILDDPSNRIVLGLGAWVDQWTWFADLQKVRGDIKGAMKSLDEAQKEYPYADASQRTMIAWKRAEIALVSKGPTSGVLAELEAVLQRAQRSADVSAKFWSSVSRIGAVAASDLAGARALVRDLQSMGGLRIDQQLFLDLQAAELERVEGDFAACRQHLLRAQKLESDHRRLPDGAATAKLTIRLISAKCEASLARSDEDRERVATKLQEIVTELEGMGAALPAAHARVVRAYVQGAPLDDLILKGWERQGWLAEAARARGGPAALSEIWQIVM
jgi:uncharacterized membrane protein YidH (DUF202 family)